MSCPVMTHPDPANLSPRAKSRCMQSLPGVPSEGALQQSPRSLKISMNLESISEGVPSEGTPQQSPRSTQAVLNLDSISQGESLAEAPGQTAGKIMQRQFSIMLDSMNTMMARIAAQSIWLESEFSQVRALQLRVLDGLQPSQVKRNKVQGGTLREDTPVFGDSQAVSSNPYVGDFDELFHGPVAKETKDMAPFEDSTSSAVDGPQKDKSKAPADKLGIGSSAIRPPEFSSVSAPGNMRLWAENMLLDFTAGIKQGLEQLAVKIAEEIQNLPAHSSSSSDASDQHSTSTVGVALTIIQPSGSDGLPQQKSVNDGLPQQISAPRHRSMRESLTDRAAELLKAGFSGLIDEHERSMTVGSFIARSNLLRAQSKESHNRFLYRFAQSSGFTAVCIVVVVLNGIWVGYECDNESSSGHDWMQSVSLAFNMWFIVELTIKIAALRTDFILGPDWRWDLLDAFCVLVSIPDFFSSSLNVSVVRILRLAKLSKTLRVMRAVKAFRSLKEILATVFFTLGSLFWSFVAMLLAAYVFAILLIQAMYLDGQSDAWLASQTAVNFSSLWRTILTLFFLITGGQDWSEFALDMAANGLYMAEFLLSVWMFFALFGLLNVVVGVFCAQAAEAQESLTDLRMEKQQEAREAKIADLLDVFHMIDTENRGLIDWKQFNDFANGEEGRAICEDQGLSLLALEPLWHVMVGQRDKDALVDYSSFVMGFMRLSNEHVSSDLLFLSHAVKALRHELKEVLHKGCNDIVEGEIKTHTAI